MSTLTTTPSALNEVVRRLTEAGIAPEVTEFQAYDEVRGVRRRMCQLVWHEPAVVTEANVPDDVLVTVLDGAAVLPSDMFGWCRYVWGVGHIALDALGVQNKLRSGEKFLPEVGEIFWVVNPPGTWFMPTERSLAAVEVASWPCQKWQRIA